MDAFNYRDGELFAEGVALSAIAERFGTPTYVYSRAHIEAQYLAYADALAGTPHLICFAVKANSNLGVLNVLARLGAGFDIVSGGELERVLAAGGSADKIVFSGVGKTRDDMRRALEVGVHCFNVESTDELERLQVVAAELGVRAPISLRPGPRRWPSSSARPGPRPRAGYGSPYGGASYGYGITTLVSDKSRVIKGGSWLDMPYWLGPGTRRFLEEDQSTSTIGFRCAMIRVGSPIGNSKKRNKSLPLTCIKPKPKKNNKRKINTFR